MKSEHDIRDALKEEEQNLKKIRDLIKKEGYSESLKKEEIETDARIEVLEWVLNPYEWERPEF